MKRMLLSSALVLGALASGTALTAAPASAEEVRCNVPMSEWKPVADLRAKLEADGWKVRRIKKEEGCYEAYAMDENNRRREVVFNPKTFEMMGEDDD